jgi:hypothetical protein
MAFWRNVSPRGAASDLWHELAQPRPHRWLFVLTAALTTVAVFSVMWREGAKGPPHPPKITYIESFAAGRTDAEIIAGNIAATRLAREREAEENRRAEDVRQMYKTLGRMSGMDVDAIEKKARADEAAEAAAKEAR